MRWPNLRGKHPERAETSTGTKFTTGRTPLTFPSRPGVAEVDGIQIMMTDKICIITSTISTLYRVRSWVCPESPLSKCYVQDKIALSSHPDVFEGRGRD